MKQRTIIRQVPTLLLKKVNEVKKAKDKKILHGHYIELVK